MEIFGKKDVPGKVAQQRDSGASIFRDDISYKNTIEKLI